MNYGEQATKLLHEILVAVCERDGLSLRSDVDPDEPARNYELAVRLGIGHVFGIREDGMKLSELTEAQVRKNTATVRKAVRESENAAFSGNRQEAYAAAERAQDAAFELKRLFGIDTYDLAQKVRNDEAP